MTGIQFVTDAKGRKTGVLIDLKKHSAIWEDFWDGLVDDVKLSNTALKQDQLMLTSDAMTDRCVGYWRFEEGTAGAAATGKLEVGIGTESLLTFPLRAAVKL